jgi:hypothetical protein
MPRPSAYKAENEIPPLVLATDGDFMEAWKAWAKDRRDRGKPLTLNAAKIQLGRLMEIALEHGTKMAAEVIYFAINCGYQGIFKPNDSQLAALKQQIRARWKADPKAVDFKLEKKRAEDEIWALWNKLEMSDEERQAAVTAISKSKSPEELRTLIAKATGKA